MHDHDRAVFEHHGKTVALAERGGELHDPRVLGVTIRDLDGDNRT